MFEGLFASTAALLLNVTSKHIRILTVSDVASPSQRTRSHLLSSAQISLYYSVIYYDSSLAPSALSMNSTLAGAIFTPLFISKLQAAFQNDSTLLAISQGLVVSNIVSITASYHGTPTFVPTATQSSRLPATSGVASVSAVTIVIICFSVFVGICVIAAISILCAVRRSSKPEPGDVMADDPRETGLGGHATDPGKRDTYFQLQASAIVKRQEKDDIFLL